MEHPRYRWLFGGLWGLIGGPLLILFTMFITEPFGGGLSDDVPFMLTYGLPFVLFFSFLVGSILYSLLQLEFFKRDNHRTIFLWGLFVIYIGVVFLMTFTTRDVYHIYTSVQSPEECTSFFNTKIKTFNTDVCYQSLAQNKRDVKFCDLIDPAGINPTFKSRCYEDVFVAQASNDPSLCEKLTDQELVDDCFESAYTDKAIIEGDVTLCDNLSHFLPRRNCYENSAGIYFEDTDISYCDALSAPEEYKNECRDQFYFDNSDEENYEIFCGNIKKIDLKRNCYDSYGEEMPVR